MKIPLFDIDWTLLKSGTNTHKKGFDVAFEKVYGVPEASIKEITTSGMIDREIILTVLKLHGMNEAAIREKMDTALECIKDYYFKNASPEECVVLPGVVELLTELKAQKIPIGLLTGNIEEIAWKKMEFAGIKQFFSFGAFGNLAYTRPDLVDIALERLNRISDTPFSLNQLVIIGDAKLDMVCAKTKKIGAIGVASGIFSETELQDAGADLTAASLENKSEIMQFLMTAEPGLS